VPQLPVSRRHALAAAGVLVVLLLVGSRIVHRSAPAQVVQPTPGTAATQAVSQPRLVVDVVGAVRRPGLYRLPAAARIADAVERAGGPTKKADLEQVNLAAPLADGEQVVVPRRTSSPGGAGPAAEPGARGPVQLSTATLEQLDALPGVGPVTAQKILDYRAKHGAFRSVDELDAVPGIGPARLDQLRDLVVP